MQMKKSFLLILAGIFSLSVLAQETIPVDETTGLAQYKEVKDVPELTPAELYTRGLAWVHKYYKNPNGVLTKQDKDNNEITGTARFKLSTTDKKGNVNPNAGFVSYNFTLQYKDGKYRYVLDGIRWERPSYYDVSKWSDPDQSDYELETFTGYIKQTIAYFDEMTENLENYMRIGEPVKNDDW
ncbi:MAG: hypothetical protein ACI8ZN_001410 [Bacteroidia bacterium]|jgi:hypothetical protein